MLKIIKDMIKYLLIIGIWIVICIFPKLIIPLFFISPLIIIYFILGMTNGFMTEENKDDKRKNNRFHLSDEFVQGAVIATTIQRNKDK